MPIRALKGNRTLDLLLTMEMLCRLSYQGKPGRLYSRDDLRTNRASPSVPGITRMRSSAWQVRDSNPRRHSQLIYSQPPLATRVTCREGVRRRAPEP